jgi:hypothetical protein
VLNTANNPLRDRGRTAQPYPAHLLHCQSLAGALPDQPALELREGGEHVRHRLTRRSRSVDGAVERDERPALPLRLRHQPGEVDHRT